MASAPPSDPYERIAHWYDVEHDLFQDDAECYVSLIQAAATGAARVLEVGAGTGRLAAALALAGHQVTAIEPSGPMRARMVSRLGRLPEKVARRVRVVAGGAPELGLPAESERFDIVLLAQSLLAHLLDPAEREEALDAVAQHLRPEGQLLIDIDLAGPRRLRETAGQLWWQGAWSLADGAGELSHFVTAQPTRDPAVARVLHIYDHCGADGLVRRVTAEVPLATLEPGEVELAVRHAGFHLSSVYGDYALTPFDATSERMILDARLVA